MHRQLLVAFPVALIKPRGDPLCQSPGRGLRIQACGLEVVRQGLGLALQVVLDGCASGSVARCRDWVLAQQRADMTIIDEALGGDALPLLPLSPLNQ